MKNPILLISVLLIYMTVSAQTKGSQAADSTRGFMFTLKLGGADFPLPGLNKVLSANGLPQADNASFFVGVKFDMGTLTDKPRLFSSSTELDIASYSKTERQMQLNVRATTLIFCLNELLIRKNRNFLYASLGVGFMGYNLYYSDHSKNPASFQDALNNFGGERSLSSGLLPLITPGINYAWATNKSKDFFLGVSVDYDIGIARKSWELGNGASLSGSPRSGANGFTAGVFLSFM